MLKTLLCSVSAAVILSSAALAQAPAPAPVVPQGQTTDEAQKQSFPAQPVEPAKDSGPVGTTPPPPLTQPKAPIADQAAPAAVGPAQSNSADSSTSNSPTTEVPLGATAQTMPSRLSPANAALDKVPITSRQLPLTNEQKQLVVQSVMGVSATTTDSDLAETHLDMFLPINAAIQPFPANLTAQVPTTAPYKYLKLRDRVLIVDPIMRTVVGEIKM